MSLTNSARFAFVLTALTALTAGCAASGDVDVDSTPASIVGGTPGGDPAVVWVQSRGGLCSGTLIDPRVVLTAKHCVQDSGASGPSAPSAFVVGIGDYAGQAGSAGRVFRVQSVYTTPGVWTEGGPGGLSGALVGQDVAVLVLVSGVSDVTPIPIRRESPSGLTGTTFTATGFGQIPSGSYGRKYTTTGTVRSVDTRNHLIYVGAVTCQGDSGGPLITQDRTVGGVVSFGNGTCGSGYGAYQAIDTYLDLIDMAIEEGGGCANDGAERCDGHDNDCNGQVDEICTQLGGGCATDADCVGGMCRSTTAGRICTAECDARHPTFGCEPGLFCDSDSGCNGYCVPIEGDHSRAEGASCTHSSECASFRCIDPGDGMHRCLSPCTGNAGECAAGEVCVASPGQCGGCLSSDLVRGGHGLGEICAADTDCASGDCLEDQGRSYCTHACTDDTGCAGGYHCRVDHCVAGARGQAGDLCQFDPGWDDCAHNLFCAQLGELSWCSELCGPSTADGHVCADGFECLDAGVAHVCAPMRGLLGTSCTADADCISQLCLPSPVTGENVCTRSCDTDSLCAIGLECVRTEDRTAAYCVEPAPAAPPPAGGGCSVPLGSAHGRAAPAALLLGLVGLVARRRRQARNARR